MYRSVFVIKYNSRLAFKRSFHFVSKMLRCCPLAIGTELFLLTMQRLYANKRIFEVATCLINKDSSLETLFHLCSIELHGKIHGNCRRDAVHVQEASGVRLLLSSIVFLPLRICTLSSHEDQTLESTAQVREVIRHLHHSSARSVRSSHCIINDD